MNDEYDEYKNKSRAWLEREKAIIEDYLENLQVISARDIIGKYDENWLPQNNNIKKEVDNDMYIHVSELKYFENKIQQSRITSLSEEQKDNILIDILKRLHKAMNYKKV